MTTWTGTAIDTNMEKSTQIGTFTLQSGSGTTLVWHTGFLEVLRPPLVRVKATVDDEEHWHEAA